MRSAMRTVEKRWLMSTTARPAGELPDVLEHVPLGLGVEGAGGLVEHEDLGVAHEGAGQRDLLPLAHAQLLAVVEPLAQHGVVAVAQAADDVVGAGVAGGGLDGGVVRRPGATLPTRMFSRAVSWYWAKSWKITLMCAAQVDDVEARAGRCRRG